MPVLRIGARRLREKVSPCGARSKSLDLNYFIPCRVPRSNGGDARPGKTVDGDYLSSDDLELLSTIAGYVAIAIENARLYQSLEQKALQIERLKDFSENIVESLQHRRADGGPRRPHRILESAAGGVARNSARRRRSAGSSRKCCRGSGGGNRVARGERACFRHLQVPT